MNDVASDLTTAPRGFLNASEVSRTRSLVLFSIGAVVGLSIAGAGLFRAQGTVTRRVPPEDLALVNQRPILRSDFITQVETDTGKTFDEATRAEKLKVLNDMVREELLVQRGLELDFAETDQDTRNALVSAVMQQILAEVTTSRPTDEQLRTSYDEHRDRYTTAGTMTVRHLVLPGGEGAAADAALGKAGEAVQALRANTPLPVVMARYGLTEAKQYGEEFYFAAKIHLGDALFERAAGLADGEVCEPLAAADGVHVVKMIENKRPRPLSFDAARAQVLTDYKNSAQEKLMDATLKFLRQRSKILIATDYSSDYRP